MVKHSPRNPCTTVLLLVQRYEYVIDRTLKKEPLVLEL